MPRTRIQDRFSRAAADGSGALVPYFTSGFPTPEVTAALIQRADALGAVAIEIGVPYSDSIADGPVIQDSYHQVLESGYRLSDTFKLVRRIRSGVEAGLIAMVSYSVVFRYGVDAFFDRASEAGFDGIISPDVPVEESATLSAAAKAADLCYIGLVALTTSASRRREIAHASSGFIYQIAVAGTTGERAALSSALSKGIESLRQVSQLPVCVGFGVSSADQVRAVCRIADGAIVGSAIVRRVADGMRRGLAQDEIVQSVSTFLAELAQAAREPDDGGG